MALAAPGLTRSLTMLSCGPQLRPAYARAVVVGIDDLLGRGGAMLMWPVLKRVLPKDDQVTRDFWHAKLATVNPHYLKGVARSLVDEGDRSGEVASAGVRSLVMHGSREKRLWRPAAYAAAVDKLSAPQRGAVSSLVFAAHHRIAASGELADPMRCACSHRCHHRDGRGAPVPSPAAVPWRSSSLLPRRPARVAASGWG